jgi:ubiquinone/menaquinone biosynthesis C-methylase UbiE
MRMSAPSSAKQAAIEQWTADPCGPAGTEGEPGSRPYFEHQLRGRAEYAPWMAEALDYAGSRGLRVLDVGCGQGIDVANYALNGAQATGVDLTPRHVELARQHLAAMGLDADVREGDAEALPFPDGSFDRVSSNGVLHHTPDMDAALREIHRVLLPSGEATVIVYNRRSFHYWIQQVVHEGLMERKLLAERSMEGVLSSGVEVSSIGARPLVRVYSPGRLRRMLRDAGFAEASTEVRHFNPSDTFITASLERRGRLRRRATLDRIGRIGGWYVIGRGRRAG